MNKQQLIDYLKNNKADLQNAQCAVFLADFVYNSYIDSDKLTKVVFSPIIEYHTGKNNLFYQIFILDKLKELTKKVYLNAIKDKKTVIHKIKKQIDIEEKTDLVWNKSKDINLLSNKELLKILKDIEILGKEWWLYGLMLEDKGQIIFEEIVPIFEKNHKISKDKSIEIVSILSHPKKVGEFTKERIELFKTCIYALSQKLKESKLIKDKRFIQIFNNYNKKYFYVKTNFYDCDRITLDFFINEIKSEIKRKNIGYFRDEIKRVEKENKEINKNKKKILSNIKFSEEDKKNIEFASILTEWMDIRKRGMMKQFYYMILILNEIAKRFKISYDAAANMTFQEVIDLLSGKSRFDKKEISRRKKGFMILYEKNKPNMFFYEKDSKDIFNAINTIKSSEIKGIIASKGSKPMVKGIARVIKNPGKEKFNHGEILVTSMTRIEFVPLMKKAKAIITDEGGLSCHAAIVSRELGIPCMIGTKIATEMIKDGDLIELDIKNSIVRIVKNEK